MESDDYDMQERCRRLARDCPDRIAKNRLTLLTELHRRFDSMPSDTLEERIAKLYKFIKYTFKYPLGIDHPEVFQE